LRSSCLSRSRAARATNGQGHSAGSSDAGGADGSGGWQRHSPISRDYVIKGWIKSNTSGAGDVLAEGRLGVHSRRYSDIRDGAIGRTSNCSKSRFRTVRGNKKVAGALRGRRISPRDAASVRASRASRIAMELGAARTPSPEWYRQTWRGCDVRIGSPSSIAKSARQITCLDPAFSRREVPRRIGLVVSEAVFVPKVRGESVRIIPRCHRS